MTTTAVIPWAVKVSGKLGECMEVAAWWLVYGRSPREVTRFVVRSVIIPSVVDHAMLSAGATSSDDTISDDIAGSPQRPGLIRRFSVRGIWLLSSCHEPRLRFHVSRSN